MSLSEHFPPDLLAEWVVDARQKTFDLVADLTDEQMMGPELSTVNPPLWEIGHHAWFQSRWVLREACGEKPPREDEDALYDSIAIAHDTRWDLLLPSRDETLGYLCEVRDRVLDALSTPNVADDVLYHTLYSTLHEDMHAEAHTYTRQTHGYPAPTFTEGIETGLVGSSSVGAVSDGEPDLAPGCSGGAQGDAVVQGGTFMFGSTPNEPFVFDNEKWAHPVALESFAISKTAVTQAEYLEFVEDYGYERKEWWCEEGWTWRASMSALHPVYWKKEGEWLRRHFDRWGDLEPDLPVIHVNWFEASAYCRWAGRRLPTEAEWEAAACAEAGGELPETKPRFPWGDEGPSSHTASLDWGAMSCVDVHALPAGDSRAGCRQIIGNLWEWTSDAFLPFPAFEPDPYVDYSEPWFATRKSMRGGCWATRSRLIRTNYRNFQTPDRQDIWVGFRTCALET